ncbi:MAG TPA: PHB depolymerase family esterase [Pyrinomonadaceae bacterium]|nr:PHB depolymerase family esterase [Pyrinomonadaceae bacterium]
MQTKVRWLSSLLVLSSAFVTVSCQTHPSTSTTKVVSKNIVEQTYVNKRGEKMPYLLFVPSGYDKQKKYPLVLWLHGGGARGNDPKINLTFGDQHGFGFLTRSDNQSRYPSFVFAPQCPPNRVWGDPAANNLTAEMNLVLEILGQLQADYSIDPARLYVMGISLGGYGAWDVIVRRPGIFAAAVPICGGGAPAKASLMKATAIWAFHGDHDESVDVSESRHMIAALKQAGANPRYTEYKDVGHNSWERAFAEPELLSWLFAQKQ